MPTCQSCGAHVSKEALRVMYSDDVDTPEECIKCPHVGKVGFASRGVDL